MATQWRPHSRPRSRSRCAGSSIRSRRSRRTRRCLLEFRVRNHWVGGTRTVPRSRFYGAGRKTCPERRRSNMSTMNHRSFWQQCRCKSRRTLRTHSPATSRPFWSHTRQRGIVVRKISTEIHGGVDVRGVLGLDESVNPAFEQIRVRLNVEADCPDEELQNLILYVQEHSTVTNTIRRPVPIILERVLETLA